MILEFSVGYNILKRNNSTTISDQSTDYYKCKFYMDKEIWKGALLSAIFMNDIGYIETVVLGECSDMLTCLVPTRIALGGYFSLYITDNDKKTNTISITLTNHYNKAKPKCNVISDIYEHINTKIDDIIYDNYQLKCYSNGVLTDVIYLGNVDEEIVKDWVYDEMTAFKSTLADVAFTGSYNDLVDVPENFQPSYHEHTSSEISDLDDSDSMRSEILLSMLVDEINLI